MEYVTLNNGVKMPALGYGVYQISKEECEKCGVSREELFITTKVWIDNYRYEKARASVLASMKKLKIDY